MATINQLRKIGKENGMEFIYDFYIDEVYFAFHKSKQVLSCRTCDYFKTVIVFLDKNSKWSLPNGFRKDEKESKRPTTTLFYNNSKEIPFNKFIEFIKAN